jgi:hypothetical protein
MRAIAKILCARILTILQLEIPDARLLAGLHINYSSHSKNLHLLVASCQQQITSCVPCLLQWFAPIHFSEHNLRASPNPLCSSSHPSWPFRGLELRACLHFSPFPARRWSMLYFRLLTPFIVATMLYFRLQ